MNGGLVSQQRFHRCAVLVVDMQNAYFNNDALHKKQSSLTQKINDILSFAKQHDIPAFNIRTEHQKNTATWTLNMKNDKQGYLFAGDADSKNVPDLIVDGTTEVIKTRDSAFQATLLSTMLKDWQIDTVIICGVSTHTCIFQTASDAYAQNINVVIAKEAVASHQPKYHKTALDILRSEYRQAVMSNLQLKQYIQNNRQQD